MSRFEPSLLASDPAERTRFLTVLRETGTIRGAAAATGVSVSTVSRLRSRDHGFAAACAAVIGDPTAHALEASLLGRLANGIERQRVYADKRVETWREYNDALGWVVLKRLWPDKYGDLGPVAGPPPSEAMTRDEFIEVIRAQPRLDPPRGEDDD